ncbi:putative small auxin-up RNA [Helianthus debilis subsp. tardiflorus]
MFDTKNLIKIARKSQEMATVRRKSTAATKAEKGHFVVYTLDGRRFVFPLTHLKTYIFRELLTMAEEEFGLPSSGPITFPCDASFMNDAANLINQRAALAKERALLQSLITKSCHPSFYLSQERTKQPMLVKVN